MAALMRLIDSPMHGASGWKLLKTMTCNKTTMRSGAAFVGALGLLVSGCAISPELQVHAAPSGPIADRQYGKVAEDHPEATALVRHALEARGGFSSEDGWRVQTTLAVRPATVGAFSDAPARIGEWSETPRVSGARRGAQLHVLSVVLEQADGSQQRMVQVSARSDQLETPNELLQQLATAAAAAVYDGREAVVE